MNHIHQQKNKNKYITANHHGSQSSKSENRDLYIYIYILQPKGNIKVQNFGLYKQLLVVYSLTSMIILNFQ